MADYWVYILTNQPRSTLYVGVTNDLVRRVLMDARVKPGHDKLSMPQTRIHSAKFPALTPLPLCIH